MVRGLSTARRGMISGPDPVSTRSLESVERPSMRGVPLYGVAFAQARRLPSTESTKGRMPHRRGEISAAGPMLSPGR